MHEMLDATHVLDGENVSQIELAIVVYTGGIDVNIVSICDSRGLMEMGWRGDGRRATVLCL